MRITISGRKMEVTDALREHIETGLAKVRTHFDKIIDANVVLAVEKRRHIAEVTLLANGIRIHGKEESDDMYASVDAVVLKLDKQVRRFKFEHFINFHFLFLIEHPIFYATAN